MNNYRSAGYRKSVKQARIRAYYRRKSMAELITENKNVFIPKVEPDIKVTIKLRGHPAMSFRSSIMPWGGWSISPTPAGAKVQQTMIGYGATP